MRDIKFRYVLKDPESGDTVSMIFTIREIEYNGLDWIYEQFEKKYSDNIDEPMFDQWNIITRDQYTGLKDKNGEEMYEGDIVELWEDGYNHEKTIGKVVYLACQDYPAFDIYPPVDVESNVFSHYKACGVILVIGNIHENPELLKE